MRIAALILGIFGAMAGFVGAILALGFSGVGGAFGMEQAGELAIMGVIALAASIVGLVGAALGIAKPRLAAALMLISAIIGVIAIFAAYAVATILLVIAAIFAFLGRGKVQTS